LGPPSAHRADVDHQPTTPPPYPAIATTDATSTAADGPRAPSSRSWSTQPTWSQARGGPSVRNHGPTEQTSTTSAATTDAPREVGDRARTARPRWTSGPAWEVDDQVQGWRTRRITPAPS